MASWLCRCNDAFDDSIDCLFGEVGDHLFGLVPERAANGEFGEAVDR